MCLNVDTHTNLAAKIRPRPMSPNGIPTFNSQSLAVPPDANATRVTFGVIRSFQNLQFGMLGGIVRERRITKPTATSMFSGIRYFLVLYPSG